MDVFKILAQLRPANTSVNLLYSVEEADALTLGTIDVSPRAGRRHVQTVVTSIVVCNTDASLPYTFDLYLFDNSTDTVPAGKNYLCAAISVSGAETKVLSLGLVLGPGHTLRCAASAADKLAFNVMGIEIR